MSTPTPLADRIRDPNNHRWDSLADSVAALEAENAALRADKERLTDVRKILEGFDTGLFQRNVNADHERGWAVKLAPYLVALARLSQWSDEQAAIDGARRKT